MIVAFFETTNATPHLETSLELAHKHLLNGDTVYYFFLGHSLLYNDFIVRRKDVLSDGDLPEYRGFKLINSACFYPVKPSPEEVLVRLPIPYFKTAIQLREFTYKNFKAGISALSSLISTLRCSRPDIPSNNRLLSEILLSGISVYEYTRKQISLLGPDIVYLFNGRFCINRAIMDAAISSGVDFLIHERGATMFKYVAEPYMQHDQFRVQKSMISNWSQSDKSEAIPIAKKFFTDIRSGGEYGWLSFVRCQIKNCLPAIPEKKKIIVYYSSSQDEMEAIGDLVSWENWPDQISAVSDLISLVGKHRHLHLYIRLHPHMVSKDPREMSPWLELKLPDNVSVLSPDSPVDSYHLLARADLVVTCGSTIGIESVFWGTPSICLGPSFYSQLGAVYHPRPEELEEYLLEPLERCNPELSYPFGYFMATFGIDYLYYTPITLFKGRFLGRNLQGSSLTRGLRKVAKLFI